MGWGEPIGGRDNVEEQPEHPGIQCHEAHPGIPHRRPKPAAPRPEGGAPTSRMIAESPVLPRIETGLPSVSVGRPVRNVGEDGAELPPDGALVDEATARWLLGDDPWMRFEVWANRAWEYAERAVAAAEDEGSHNRGVSLGEEARYDPRAATLLDVARLAADLATECCPISALSSLPGRLPDLDVVIPPIRIR